MVGVTDEGESNSGDNGRDETIQDDETGSTQNERPVTQSDATITSPTVPVGPRDPGNGETPLNNDLYEQSERNPGLDVFGPSYDDHSLDRDTTVSASYYDDAYEDDNAVDSSEGVAVVTATTTVNNRRQRTTRRPRIVPNFTTEEIDFNRIDVGSLGGGENDDEDNNENNRVLVSNDDDGEVTLRPTVPTLKEKEEEVDF